ncbi:hypothetical protein TSUD_410240 [Trifolium subterraneum]|uniref:Uncharacterized protein n=1 Tax=Trifolium subterraneum TaxID=3900 RepID=A0A2Z6P7A5_TRISU|nr:hypothetical protein TSUD_410240 [Trifolium subterraneum]
MILSLLLVAPCLLRIFFSYPVSCVGRVVRVNGMNPLSLWPLIYNNSLTAHLGYSVKSAECDAAVQEEAPTETTTHLLGRLARIHDILIGLMISDKVSNGSHIYKELESAYTLTFVLNQGRSGSSSQH